MIDDGSAHARVICPLAKRVAGAREAGTRICFYRQSAVITGAAARRGPNGPLAATAMIPLRDSLGRTRRSLRPRHAKEAPAARWRRPIVKGLVFTEFLDLVDEQFSIETCERIIEMSPLPSGGIYTSVGTYEPQEMKVLLGNLTEVTGIPAPDLLQTFGRHLFGRFFATFPVFFEGITSTFDFLPLVESYVHVEVRKLYADTELPTFECEMAAPGTMILTYRSKNDLPDLAEGLILGCIEHFGDSLTVRRERLGGDPPSCMFTIASK
jgi:hypothetical protein